MQNTVINPTIENENETLNNYMTLRSHKMNYRTRNFRESVEMATGVVLLGVIIIGCIYFSCRKKSSDEE